MKWLEEIVTQENFSNDARHHKTPGLSFHQLPLYQQLRKRWFTEIRRDPGKHFKVGPVLKSKNAILRMH